jgi:hypothetical protein
MRRTSSKQDPAATLATSSGDCRPSSTTGGGVGEAASSDSGVASCPESARTLRNARTGRKGPAAGPHTNASRRNREMASATSAAEARWPSARTEMASATRKGAGTVTTRCATYSSKAVSRSTAQPTECRVVARAARSLNVRGRGEARSGRWSSRSATSASSKRRNISVSVRRGPVDDISATVTTRPGSHDQSEPASTASHGRMAARSVTKECRWP